MTTATNRAHRRVRRASCDPCQASACSRACSASPAAASARRSTSSPRSRRLQTRLAAQPRHLRRRAADRQRRPRRRRFVMSGSSSGIDGPKSVNSRDPTERASRGTGGAGARSRSGGAGGRCRSGGAGGFSSPNMRSRSRPTSVKRGWFAGAAAASMSDKSSSGLRVRASSRGISRRTMSGRVAVEVSEKSYPQLRQRSTCSKPR